MKIEEYELGQKVSLYGVIEEINIEDIYDIENTTTLKINTLTRTISVNPKWEEVTIELDQQKPVVPQFVADWYESLNRNEDSFRKIFPFVHAPHESTNDTSWIPEDVQIWLSDWDNSFTLSNMHQFGYTVEKEKLYTVKIPNPNTVAITILARSIVGDVVIYNEFDTCWKKNSRYQLTKQEIRKDFDWAFRWAKEVE